MRTDADYECLDHIEELHNLYTSNIARGLEPRRICWNERLVYAEMSYS
jgi:hypothetical protein